MSVKRQRKRKKRDRAKETYSASTAIQTDIGFIVEKQVSNPSRSEESKQIETRCRGS